MRIRTAVQYVALPASAALFALTGCASSGSGGPSAASTGNKATPLSLIKAAYTSTTAAKSARIATSITVNNASGAKNLGVAMTGVEDFEHHRSDTTTSWDSMGTIEQRQIGPDIYIKMTGAMAAAQRQLNANKPWSHTRIVNDPIPAALSSIMGGANADPTALVKLLTSVTSSVTAVGSDDVRGQHSTHYRMTFDEAKIRKLDAQMGDCPDDEPTAGTDSNTPLDVWLDGQGRLTRMWISITQDASSAESGGATSVTPLRDAEASGAFTVEFYDYGAPVSIEAPPADQTKTISDPLGDSSDSSSCVGSGTARPTAH